jgi:hypothetical protein
MPVGSSRAEHILDEAVVVHLITARGLNHPRRGADRRWLGAAHLLRTAGG